MSAVHVIRDELRAIGYREDAVLTDYVFADVLAPASRDRKVDLAAFTQFPPSYRNAAIGVVVASSSDAAQVVADNASLGSPLFFSLSDGIADVWQVRTDRPPLRLASTDTSALPALFAAHRAQWNPEAIQRAKSIGPVDEAYQLDFVDAGLLPAIEGQIHAKLDRLLKEVLYDAKTRAPRIDERILFRTTFRLIAAKILQDRGHEIAHHWTDNNLAKVLDVITTHYNLPGPPTTPATVAAFESAWHTLRSGMSFRNVSADDLAFVYENTLVTSETRQRLGTHSTPRQIADFVVRQLRLWEHEPAYLRVYEPFTGAGAFLVAAVRQIKDLLPPTWSSRQRHAFLVERVGGDELDAFAREVAMLSLILADYPNTNGWQIGERDLFSNGVLTKRAGEHNIVLCNPPFESFTREQRSRYHEAVGRSESKAFAALDAVLDAHPLALGFVLPEKFVSGPKGLRQRKRIEALYRTIEIVQLPDRTFEASVVRSCLVVARDQRTLNAASTTIFSTDVSVRDRERFLATGAITERRQAHREVAPVPNGQLWIPRLAELWAYLRDYEVLKPHVTIRNGLQWTTGQEAGVSPVRKPGHHPGIHRSGDLEQYVCRRPAWLDTDPKHLRRGADFEWQTPKLLATASQLSRGPWCFAACYDTRGLYASQQVFAIWLAGSSRLSHLTLLAILNSPLASAFMSEHSPKDRFRIATLNALPLPASVSDQLANAVESYLALFEHGQPQQEGEALLKKIDALVLAAYALPPRLEKTLLEFFRDHKRPVEHSWNDWFPRGFLPTIPLLEYLSPQYAHLATGAILDAASPLPTDAAALLGEYLD